MFTRNLTSLQALAATRAFATVDLQLAGLICGLAKCDDPRLATAAAAVSREAGNKSVCVDIAQLAATGIPLPDGTAFRLQDLEEMLAALATSPVVSSGDKDTPLVLDGTRLYLRRYWEYEREVAEGLLSRTAAKPEITVASDDLKKHLDSLFPRTKGEDSHADLQKLAAFTALRSSLCVISGGPGTGKTYTVARILALLLLCAGDGAGKLRLAMAAPTGKAAARLSESMSKALAAIDVSETIRNLLPREASTLHRLLGSMPGSPHFRRNKDNPLALDALVVDEASMVDLPLMAKLLRALPANTKLILLGDKDQLASVEAGAVLGDICTGDLSCFTRAHLNAYAAVDERRDGLAVAPEPAPPLTDCLVQLTRSRRFSATGGIGAFAAAVRDGDADKALGVARAGGEVSWIETISATALREAFKPAILDGYAPALEARDPAEALRRLDALRVLTPLRDGPFGIEALNALSRDILEEAGLIPRGRAWYKGRPVMVTRNDYALRLFNGDVGIAWPEPDGSLRVHFPRPDGTTRAFGPARLPEHETVFAMTVHKSQGSEFGKVVLVLPDRESPVLTRELIYTAITRAQKKIICIASEMMVTIALINRRIRSTELASRLLVTLINDKRRCDLAW